jgi:hypothetical protein
MEEARESDIGCLLLDRAVRSQYLWARRSSAAGARPGIRNYASVVLQPKGSDGPKSRCRW